jgi:hypothetical protein
MYRYAHGHGCEVTEKTAPAATNNGHSACLAWTFEKGEGRFTSGGSLYCAEWSRQAECVKLAVAHGCREYSSYAEPGAECAGEMGVWSLCAG